MKLHILRADPAGNITLFVLDRVEPERRAAIAAQLMRALSDMQIEQVAFACPAEDGLDGHMEMMGGEFCGNATRAYAMYLARERGQGGALRLRVSGCERTVSAKADPFAGTASAEMPLPRALHPLREPCCTGTLVDLGGIALLVTCAAPDEAVLRAAEPVLARLGAWEAYGVIFLDREAGRITPLIKVVQTGTLVWEGSCGSGSVACAFAESAGIKDGVFERTYLQPAGAICARVKYRGGKAVCAEIGGPVSLGEVQKIDLP